MKALEDAVSGRGGRPVRALLVSLAILFVAASANAAIDVGAAIHDVTCRH